MRIVVGDQSHWVAKLKSEKGLGRSALPPHLYAHKIPPKVFLAR
jgi:hypothetical protein